MATAPFLKIENPPGGEYDNVFRRQWTLTDGDEGEGVALPRHADRSIQVTGPFGGATLKIEGTLDGVEWGVLTDQSDNDLIFTSYPAGYATKIEVVAQAVLAVRPKVVGGDGTNLTVTLLARS